MIKVPLLPVAPVDFVDDLRPPRARARVRGAFHFRPSKNTGPGNRGIEAGSRPASLDLSIRAETLWNLLEEAPRSCSDSSAVQRLSSCQGEEAANGQWPIGKMLALERTSPRQQHIRQIKHNNHDPCHNNITTALSTAHDSIS